MMAPRYGNVGVPLGMEGGGLMQSRSYQDILDIAVAVAIWLAAAPAFAQSEIAAALVEEIENAPEATVSFLDYVYPGQVIELGAAGTIVLSYFISCRVETVTGGRLEVTREASVVSGGRLSREGGRRRSRAPSR